MLDLSQARLGAGLRMPAPNGAVASVRAGKPVSGTLRIVFDLGAAGNPQPCRPRWPATRLIVESRRSDGPPASRPRQPQSLREPLRRSAKRTWRRRRRQAQVRARTGFAAPVASPAAPLAMAIAGSRSFQPPTAQCAHRMRRPRLQRTEDSGQDDAGCRWPRTAKTGGRHRCRPRRQGSWRAWSQRRERESRDPGGRPRAGATDRCGPRHAGSADPRRRQLRAAARTAT